MPSVQSKYSVTTQREKQNNIIMLLKKPQNKTKKHPKKDKEKITSQVKPLVYSTGKLLLDKTGVPF